MSSPSFRSITLILSPYHVGIANMAVGRGPTYLQNRGIIDVIRKKGFPVHEVIVPSVEDDLDDEITRSFELIRRTSKLVRSAQETCSFPIILAGNCSASVGVAAGLSHAVSQLGKELGCVWFDAHDDFNTPDTMASGYFDSMPIAMMSGLGFKTLLSSVPGFKMMNLEKLVHVGMRDVSDIERHHVEEAGLSVVWGDESTKVHFEAELSKFLDEKGTELQPTLVHLDADCLDTSIGWANRFAAPGGLLKEDMLGCLQTTVAKSIPLALTVASFDPGFEGADNIADAVIVSVSAFVDSLKSKGILDRAE
ncbi:hypothetical protein IL306_001737 [Fusarium sp. DS 682]|nr:hypothetical protein IL306_001737 [Fusarium sp. DS 682]